MDEVASAGRVRHVTECTTTDGPQRPDAAACREKLHTVNAIWLTRGLRCNGGVSKRKCLRHCELLVLQSSICIATCQQRQIAACIHVQQHA